MESLLRTQVSEFLLKDALKIGEIEQLVKECTKELPPEAWSRAHFPFVRSVDSVFLQYQKGVVPEQFSKVLYNGMWNTCDAVILWISCASLYASISFSSPDMCANTRSSICE